MNTEKAIQKWEGEAQWFKAKADEMSREISHIEKKVKEGECNADIGEFYIEKFGMLKHDFESKYFLLAACLIDIKIAYEEDKVNE